MGYTEISACNNCPECIGCGRRFKTYKQFHCDKCGDETNELYYDFKSKELCWDCYKEQFLEKICDDLDDTLCAECGSDDEFLYLYNGEWVCTSCLKSMAERIEMEDDR